MVFTLFCVCVCFVLGYWCLHVALCVETGYVCGENADFTLLLSFDVVPLAAVRFESVTACPCISALLLSALYAKWELHREKH